MLCVLRGLGNYQSLLIELSSFSTLPLQHLRNSSWPKSSASTNASIRSGYTYGVCRRRRKIETFGRAGC